MATNSATQRPSAPGSAPAPSSVVLSALLAAGDARSSLILATYGEYARLRETGQNPDPDEFCKQHPALEDALQELISIEEFAEERCRLSGKPLFPAAGESFGRFELIEQLGEGSFARVFRAEVPNLGNRSVVVKISTLGKIEGKFQGPLEHPNIVPANWVEEVEGTDLVAVMMPYLGRATLEHLLTRLPKSSARSEVSASAIAAAIYDPALPAATTPALLRQGTYFDGVCFLAEQVARGLAYLHSQGVQHRDLKPSNVLVTPAAQALVMDFNLSAHAHVKLGNIIFGGTLVYMSPEQLIACRVPPWERRATLEARTDLFSFGVILYELLARQHPYCSEPPELEVPEMIEYLLEQQAQGFRPLKELCPQGNDEILGLIARCLASRPEDRPASAEVADILAGYLKVRQEQLEPAPPRSVVTTGKVRPIRTRRLTVAVCLLLAAGFAVARMMPSDLADHYRLGTEAYQSGKYQESVGHFNRVIEVDAENSKARFARARAAQQWAEQEPKRFADAITYYKDCLDRMPARPEVAACVAYCLHRNAQLNEAENFYKLALNGGFKAAAFFNNFGVWQYKKNHLFQALASLDEAIKIDPKLTTPYHTRGLICRQLVLSPAHDLNKVISPKQRQEYIKKAQSDMARALYGPPSQKLFKDAALVYALTNPPSEESLQKTCECLRKAIEFGLTWPLPPSEAKSIEHLKATTDFQELSALKTGRRGPVEAHLIVDPLHGQLELP